MQGATSVDASHPESRRAPSTASASLEIFESGGGRAPVAVPREGLRLGRALDQDVVLSAPTISKHHALLYWQGDDLFVRDLDSRNGTRRDGIPLRGPTRLHDDDELVVGGAVAVRVHLREGGFGAPLSELTGSEAPLVPAPAGEAASLDIDLIPLVTSLYRAASHEELAFQLTRRAGTLLGASRAAVLEIEADERYRTLGLCKTSRLDERPLQDARFVSRTVLERARREGASLFRESADQTNASLVRSGAHAAIAARIPTRDRRERILYLDCTLGEPPFTDAHRRALELIAVHAGGAFDALDAQLAGGRERTRFEQLRRYFSPAVVEHILDAGGEAVEQPRNLEATVLFADLVGYTKLSERLRDEPERLLSILNRWLDVGAQIVVRHGGTLDKFIGDCVMAVFGAPFPIDRAELVAVECALEMREAIAQIAFEENLPLAITVGINSGELLAGSVGSRRRLEYTVLGDTVNVASRLQSQATSGEILIGPLTAGRVAGAVFIEDAGVRSLKNHGPVQAHRVLGLMRHTHV